MKTYQYILFDWDGCLAKTLDIILNAYKVVFAEYDIYPADKAITQEVFGDWNGPKKFGIEDIDSYTNKYLAKVNETYPLVSLYENVRETLIALKQRNKRWLLLQHHQGLLFNQPFKIIM